MNESYAALAELLVPGSNGRGLDRVLAALPELDAPLRAVLERIGPGEPRQALASLDEESQRLLALAVVGGYLTEPAVVHELGYRNREATPLRDDIDDEVVGLIQVVLDRGRIYRTVPQ